MKLRILKTSLFLFLSILLFTPLVAQDTTHTGLVFTDEAVYEKIGEAAMPLGAGEVPSKVDLSPQMPPVGNQNPQNSCVAWATTYACRSYYEKINKNYSYYKNGQVDYSHILSPSYVYNQINNGQNRGTLFKDAFKIMIDEGACTYKSMPYRPRDWVSTPNATQEKEAQKFKIETYRRVNLKNGAAITSIQAELIAKNPVIVASLYDKSYYNSGFNAQGTDYVWRSVGNIDYRMGHAILIVGYDDTKKAFKFMNSWGTRWGNKGYGWISYSIVDRVIREAYILKPKYTSSTTTDNTPTPEFLTETHNDLNTQDVQQYGLDFSITNVQHQNNMNAAQIPIPQRQMFFNGVVKLPAHAGRSVQVVINFYVNNNGVKGNLVGSHNYNYALANGQAATGTQVVQLRPEIPFQSTWQASIPYAVLKIPRGRFIQTQFGPRFQAATSYLLAEPVLFVDNFPIRIGKLIPFVVSL